MATNEKEKEVVELEEEEEEETSELPENIDALKARIKTLEEKSITSRERRRADKQELVKLRKELEGLKIPKDPASSKEEKKGLDRVDRAILRAEKITASEEIELVESIMKETGKDVEGVLASKYFQGELKVLRDAAALKDATPSGTKRSGQSGRDSVEYWLSKEPGPDGLPKDNPELARKVVAARTAKAKNTNQFSDEPIQ